MTLNDRNSEKYTCFKGWKRGKPLKKCFLFNINVYYCNVFVLHKVQHELGYPRGRIVCVSMDTTCMFFSLHHSLRYGVKFEGNTKNLKNVFFGLCFFTCSMFNPT